MKRQYLMTNAEFQRLYTENYESGVCDFQEFYEKVMQSINNKIDILVMNSNYFTMIKGMCEAWEKNLEMGNHKDQEISPVPTNWANINDGKKESIDPMNFEGDE